MSASPAQELPTQGPEVAANAQPVESSAQRRQSEQALIALKRLTSKLTPRSSGQDYLRCIDASNKVHLSLLRNHSKLGDVPSKTSTMKHRLADLQTRDISRDKRFCQGFGMERMRDLKPSFAVYLFPGHFKLNSFAEGFSYNGPMKPFIDGLERQELLPVISLLLDQSSCVFYDGCLLVEVFDHRRFLNGVGGEQTALPQYETYRVLLHPTPLSLMTDMMAIQDRNGITDDEMLSLESSILLATEDNLCLDPSPIIGIAANLVDYNKKKHRASSKNDDVQTTNITSDLEQMMQLVREDGVKSPPDFKQISFVEEWRRSKDSADMTPTAGFDKNDKSSSIRIRKKSTVQQLLRTIKFVQRSRTQQDRAVFTILNIYVCSNGSFELVLRYGSQPDTSINGRSLTFHLPTSSLVEAYANNLKMIYGQCESNQLLEDVSSNIDPQKTLLLLQQQQQFGPSQSASPATTATSSVPQQSSQSSTGPTLPKNQQAPVVHNRMAATGVSSGPTVAQAAPSSSSGGMTVRQFNASQLQQVEERLHRHGAQIGRSRISQPASNPAAAAAAASNIIKASKGQSPSQSPPPPVNSVHSKSFNMSPGTNSTSSTSSPQITANSQSAQAAVIQALQMQARKWPHDQLHKLVALPYDQVPEEHKQLYVYLRQQLRKRRQSQEAMLLQQQQQANETVAASVPRSQSPSQINQVLSQQLLNSQNAAQQQALLQSQVTTAQQNLLLQNRLRQLQQSQLLAQNQLQLQQMQLKALQNQQSNNLQAGISATASNSMQRSLSQPQVNSTGMQAHLNSLGASLQNMQGINFIGQGMINPSVLNTGNPQQGIPNNAASTAAMRMNLAAMNAQQGTGNSGLTLQQQASALGLSVQNMQALLRQHQFGQLPQNFGNQK